MEFRFHHVFLKLGLFFGTLPAIANENAYQTGLKLNQEVFEIGTSAGVLAIQDFNAELSLGLNTTFHASEDFFLQLNYLQADASLSAFESSQDLPYISNNRTFSHYDLLLGYNLMLGELYPKKGKTTLSRLYIVAGVGNVSFGAEKRFATTLGVGYKLDITRRWNVRVDFRDYVYRSNLTRAQTYTSHNTEFSIGIGYLL